MYHFVWILKYPYKVFFEHYREVMKPIIHKIAYEYNFDIQELAIPEDHIHIVFKGEPKIAPIYVMQVIKSIPAREFFKLYRELKK